MVRRRRRRMQMWRERVRVVWKGGGGLSASASIALGAAVTHPPSACREFNYPVVAELHVQYMSPLSSTTVIHGKYLGDACRRETRETWRRSLGAMASRIMPVVFRSSGGWFRPQDVGAGWMPPAETKKARNRTEVIPCCLVETRQRERERERERVKTDPPA